MLFYKFFEATVLDCYDYGARFYDPALGRWHVIDPAIENNHYEHSPYVYVYNDPIRLVDPNGLDSLQRAQAITKSQEYVDQNPGDSYEKGAKGAPGENVDCSGVVSASVVAGGESDPNYGGTVSGVLNIEDNTTKVGNSEAEPGNIITFRNSDGYPYHTGLITGIERDSDGNITKVNYNHSASSAGGPESATFDVSNPGNLSIHGFYKWDTKPDVQRTAQTQSTVSAPTKQGFIKNMGSRIGYAMRKVESAIMNSMINF